jgi:hypothetical protein
VIEDQRGVDIGQIRRQLRLWVPERVRTMVEAAHVMMTIQTTAQASPQHGQLNSVSGQRAHANGADGLGDRTGSPCANSRNNRNDDHYSSGDPPWEWRTAASVVAV